MSALETHEEGGGIVSEVTQTPARYEARGPVEPFLISRSHDEFREDPSSLNMSGFWLITQRPVSATSCFQTECRAPPCPPAPTQRVSTRCALLYVVHFNHRFPERSLFLFVCSTFFHSFFFLCHLCLLPFAFVSISFFRFLIIPLVVDHFCRL